MAKYTVAFFVSSLGAGFRLDLQVVMLLILCPDENDLSYYSFSRDFEESLDFFNHFVCYCCTKM